MKIRIASLCILLILQLFITFCGSRDYDKTVKPNILLITVDTLRKDHLGVYGYYRETSPFIDQLAKDGLMYRNAITPLPLTAGSHATIITSLHPLTHNITMNGARLNDKVQTIADVLSTNGYYTIGAVSVGLLSKEKNFSKGFAAFSDILEKDRKLDPKFPLYERTAEATNESLFKLIEEYSSKPGSSKKPLFIWVHYFDPHGPYYVWDETPFKTPLKKGIPKSVNKYDKEIRYTDQHIKGLYEFLNTKGLTQKMVTCITADHGEQFGEHGYCYGHADFYSENTFVPLILNGYGIPKAKIIDKYVSTTDIAVTLLGMTGKTFDNPIHGIDLLKRDKEFPYTYEYPDRDLLIIGNPMYCRSLQWLSYPYSYILNFDYHYKYWYISDEPSALNDSKLLKPIPEKQLRNEGNGVAISFPYTNKKGRNFVVIKGEIENNKGGFVRIKVLPFLSTTKQSIPKKSRYLNVIYPVTVMDSLRVFIRLKENAKIKNLQYAIVFGKELNPETAFKQKITNKIFTQLLTQRKKKKENELFDLSSDFEMTKNLVTEKQFKPMIIRFQKFIYTTFKYFLQKGNDLLKGVTEDRNLSAEDKKMLKTLGYL